MQRRKEASLRHSDVRQHQKGKRDQPPKFIIKKGKKEIWQQRAHGGTRPIPIAKKKIKSKQ